MLYQDILRKIKAPETAGVFFAGFGKGGQKTR